MIRLPLIAAAIVQISTPVGAEVFSLVCENSRREYVVTYDIEANTVVAGGTDYSVLDVERTEQRFVVSGQTVEGGPKFKLHLRPYKKLDFYSGNFMDQTDGCY